MNPSVGHVVVVDCSLVYLNGGVHSPPSPPKTHSFFTSILYLSVFSASPGNLLPIDTGANQRPKPREKVAATMANLSAAAELLDYLYPACMFAAFVSVVIFDWFVL